jgi:molybdate transport system regulatory protein
MPKNNKINVSIEFKPCSKIWLVKGEEYAFGGGIAGILSAIRKTGSIKGASVLLKESYRYVWGRIQKTEEVLGVKLIETTVGGQSKSRAQLTEFAERLLNPYIKFEATINKQVNKAFLQMLNEIKRGGNKK